LTTATLEAGVNDHTYDIGFYDPAVAVPIRSSGKSSAPVSGTTQPPVVSEPVGMGNYTWIDTNKNGMQDPNEAPLSGVRVRLYHPDGSPARNRAGGSATATTDRNGYYFIDNLDPGSYYAVFELPPGYSFTLQSSSGSTSANDSNPEVATGKTLVFAIGTSLRGDTVTDTNPQTIAVWVNPTVDAGVVPVRGVSVGNLVWRDQNGDGIQGRYDKGIAGAKLSISTSSGGPAYDLLGRLVRPQITKSDGLYMFNNLPPGRYVVSIVYPKSFIPTTRDRPGRERNSSTKQATSLELTEGMGDMSLDFGVVKIGSLPSAR
jgi:protocatechuate 3,4-dioxygenase beta subunit